MADSWAQRGYSEVSTGDGSPSLRPLSSADAEMMHHRDGALSESRLIYGRLLRPAVDELANPHILSLGLGLGYNEALLAEEALLHDRPWRCVSYEADPFLFEAFLAFLSDQVMDQGVRSTYEKIFQGIAESLRVKRALLQAYECGRWVLQSALTTETRVPFPIHGFLWDAFSQKTSPALWEENFLADFLEKNADTRWSGLSTYACVGALKRALRKSGFGLEVLPGFSGKRCSTLAWRKAIPE